MNELFPSLLSARRCKLSNKQMHEPCMNDLHMPSGTGRIEMDYLLCSSVGLRNTHAARLCRDSQQRRTPAHSSLRLLIYTMKTELLTKSTCTPYHVSQSANCRGVREAICPPFHIAQTSMKARKPRSECTHSMQMAGITL